MSWPARWNGGRRWPAPCWRGWKWRVAVPCGCARKRPSARYSCGVANQVNPQMSESDANQPVTQDANPDGAEAAAPDQDAGHQQAAAPDAAALEEMVRLAGAMVFASAGPVAPRA